MEQFEKKEENGAYHNPHLLPTALLAGVAGLLIYSLIAWLWMLWVS